jgi:nucleoredoxin
LFNQLQGGKEAFEIVFCSMDRNESEYAQYAGKMAWWCLPYAISTLPRLTAIYQAHGMPHLVVIDTDGKTITKSGVECLTEDPVGKKFPWRPTRIIDCLSEDYLVVEDEDEAVYPIENLDEKYLLLYFSAKSDALSQEFTPWLIKAYNILKKQRPNDFEVSITTSCCVCVCSVCVCVCVCVWGERMVNA